MSHYPFAQYADRTLGLVLAKDPALNQIHIRRFRRARPFPTINPNPPTDPFEADVPLTQPFECVVSATGTSRGLLGFDNDGWSEFWDADQALLLGAKGSYTGNQVEAPTHRDWPATTTGSSREVTIRYTPPAAGARPQLTWSMPRGATGTVPFRVPVNVREPHGVAVVLRLCGGHGGQLRWISGNPWNDGTDIVWP